MKKLTSRNLVLSVVLGVLVPAAVLASNLTIPNLFTAGSPIKSADVNANFAAVKAAVDDSQTQITAVAGRVTALETNACPTGTISRLGMCVETTLRPGVTWHQAVAVCGGVQRRLCPPDVLADRCSAEPWPAGREEWSNNETTAWIGNPPDCSNGSTSGQDIYPKQFRCCLQR